MTNAGGTIVSSSLVSPCLGGTALFQSTTACAPWLCSAGPPATRGLRLREPRFSRSAPQQRHLETPDLQGRLRSLHCASRCPITFPMARGRQLCWFSNSPATRRRSASPRISLAPAHPASCAKRPLPSLAGWDKGDRHRQCRFCNGFARVSTTIKNDPVAPKGRNPGFDA